MPRTNTIPNKSERLAVTSSQGLARALTQMVSLTETGRALHLCDGESEEDSEVVACVMHRTGAVRPAGDIGRLILS